jgi:hypothetical protein
MDSTLLKFHGRFADLIPYGFKFQKLYANNYRQYCLDVVEHCESIRVWQAHGGYIEINDWFSASKAVVEAVIKGNFKWHKYVNRDDSILGFTIIRKTGEIVPFEREKHDHLANFIALERAGKSQEETTIALNDLCKIYRVDRITPEMIAVIKDMHAKGWIRV